MGDDSLWGTGALAAGRARAFPRARRPGDARRGDRVADAALRTLCAAAALLAVLLVVAVAYRLFSGAAPAISQFGAGFLVNETWQPNFGRLGAATFIYGTAVASVSAMVLAVPLGISIGLFLGTVAPDPVRRVVGPLVEMLAAVPTVILGFWGILVFGPFLRAHVEPLLHRALGFIPLFGTPSATGAGLFTASLILAIMVVPIIAAISRDLFLRVPSELRDAAIALGATRWELVRGVIVPATGSGLVAASVLGLGRALGEAIATSQVVGAGNFIHASLFATGDTLASRIAGEVGGAPFKLQHASLFYLGAILLVIGLVANLAARLIMRRFDMHATTARAR